MEIQGKLIHVGESEKIGDTNAKMTFVVEYGVEYPKKAAFDLWNDKMEKIMAYSIGDSITVSFNIDSRSFNRKDGTKGIITNLQAWKISGEAAPKQENAMGTAKKADDLPF
jgi:hypothetical protein